MQWFNRRRRAAPEEIARYQRGVILVQLADGGIMSVSALKTGCCVTIFRLSSEESIPTYLSDIAPIGKRGGWLVDQLPAFVSSVASKMCVTVGEFEVKE